MKVSHVNASKLERRDEFYVYLHASPLRENFSCRTGDKDNTRDDKSILYGVNGLYETEELLIEDAS